MAIPHAGSGEIIDLRPLGAALAQSTSTTLVRAEHLEVVRLVLPRGKVLQEHRAAGTMTLLCLEGSAEVRAHGRTQTLQAGEMLYLADAVPHAVTALTDASLLLTLLLRRA